MTFVDRPFPPEVDLLGFKWNVSPAKQQIGTDIHGPQKMDINYFDDPLTSPLKFPFIHWNVTK